MLDQLLSIFKSKPVHSLAMVTSIAANIIKTFEQEYASDKNARDAAIDTLVDLLKLHKSMPTEAPAAPAQPSK